jgi:hypothetical protein
MRMVGRFLQLQTHMLDEQSAGRHSPLLQGG